jgi:hypothetical protein
MALVTCKECKQQVSDGASACPHCGAKVRKKTSALTWIVSAVFAFIVFGMVTGDNDGNSNRVSGATVATPAAEPPISVSAVDLARAYERNEAAADAAYKGRLLRVTGVVASIDKDLFDNTVVQLDGVNTFLGVAAELEESEEEQAIALRKGQTVTVLCRGDSEVIGAPMLDECTFQAPSVQVSEAK